MPIVIQRIFAITLAYILTSCATVSNEAAIKRDFTGVRSTDATCTIGSKCGYTGRFAKAKLSVNGKHSLLYLRDEETHECIVIITNESQLEEFNTLNTELEAVGNFPEIIGVSLKKSNLPNLQNKLFCDGKDQADYILEYQSVDKIILVSYLLFNSYPQPPQSRRTILPIPYR